MFDEKHFVPILKGKQGELRALREAVASGLGGFTPLIELVGVTPKYLEGEDTPVPSKSDSAHVEAAADAIVKAWTPGRPLFLDGFYIEQMAALVDGREPFGTVLDALREAGIAAIPVTGLDRLAEYDACVKAAVAVDGRGICIRIVEPDLESVGDLDGQLASTLKYYDLPPSEVDIIVDFGPSVPAKSAVIHQVNSIPRIEQWRTFTLASSSFPKDMSGVSQYSIQEIPRQEYLVWSFLRSKTSELKRMPTYGDYSINHPEVAEIDPRKMRQSANIRYTSTNTYVIAKGEALPRAKDTVKKAPASEQYPKLAKALTKHASWQGESFSWGDGYIMKCAKKECVGGGREWRAVGVSHHIAFVVKQLTSPPSREAFGGPA